MLKKLLVSVALVSLLATPAFSAEMITNGGFEDGLTGWNLINTGSYVGAEWYTIYDEIEVGNQVGFTPWDYQVRQDVEPVKVSDIQEFSVSARLAYTSTAVVVVTYVVEYPLSPYSDYQYVYIEPEDLTWGTYDILPVLDPTKTIESIKLSGYASAKPAGAWFDDVTLKTFDEVVPMITSMVTCEPTIEYVDMVEYVNVPVVEYVNVEVPVIQYVDKIVEKIVTVEKTVRVEVPTIKYVDKIVEKIVKVEVEVPVVEFVTVEVEVPVVEFVDRVVEKIVEVEVPVVEFITSMVSSCDSIDYSGMSKKDVRSVKKSCEHISKWEARIAKVTSGQGDNNGHHKTEVAKKTCNKNSKGKKVRNQYTKK